MTGVITGTYEWSTDIITMLRADQWVTIITSVILPIWIFGVFDRTNSGLRGIYDRLTSLIDVGAYFMNLGIKVVQVTMAIVGRLLEAIGNAIKALRG